LPAPAATWRSAGAKSEASFFDSFRFGPYAFFLLACSRNFLLPFVLAVLWIQLDTNNRMGADYLPEFAFLFARLFLIPLSAQPGDVAKV